MTQNIFYFLLIPFFAITQDQISSSSYIDKSYDEILDLYNKEESNKKSLIYADAYLKKGRKEHDTSKILTGFHLKALLFKDNKREIYFDSILELNKNYKDPTYPAAIYLAKGNKFYRKRNFKTALDFYIKAKLAAEKNKSPFLILSCNQAIGMVRDRTNDSIEALKIHRKNYQFVVDNLEKFPKTIHVKALYDLANSYNNNRMLDSANFYNKIGLKEAIKSEYYMSDVHLMHLNNGTTQFYLNNFGTAINSLEKASNYFKKINDKPNLSEALFFLGKSQLKVNKVEHAIENFKKIDTIFQTTNDLLPRLRDFYPLLIKYYKKSKNLELQLEYLNRLIKLDSIIATNEIYISKSLIKKYDLPQIIEEKEAIISSLKNKNTKDQRITISIIVLLSISILLLYLQYYKKKIYKERFQKLIEKNKINSISKKEIITSVSAQNKVIEKRKDFNIPNKVIDQILKSLVDFEKKKLYLNRDLNIQNLAKAFDTNSSYLSKVINIYKKQNFNSYVNSLRIDYAVSEIQKNSTLQKFTISALAKEVGFNSAESFSKSFHKKTGIYPSYFIKNLKREIQHSKEDSFS